MKKFVLIVALSFNAVQSASAEEMPASCATIINALQACSTNLLSVAENTKEAHDPQTIAELREALGPNGIIAQVRSAALSQGYKVSNARCSVPATRHTVAHDMEGIASSISMLNGDPSDCLFAIGELQNTSSAQ